MSVFGDETDEVLGKLKVAFLSSRYMYMGVRDQDGNLGVGTHHLKHSDLRTLYLDVVHELFHVKQFMEDKASFRREHQRYLKHGFDYSLYYTSPIEVPAYRYTVEEAKRIGMTRDEIEKYLEMGPAEPEVFSRFLKSVGAEKEHVRAAPKELPVSINRRATVPLYPFMDYFKGFEEVPAIRGLFGTGTERVLARLKVEFTGMQVNLILPDLDDGHLQVSALYLRTGDARLLYMDVVLCLNILKRSSDGMTPKSGRKQPDSPRALFDSFAAAVREARRIGVSDIELKNHLTTPRFLMSPTQFRKVLKKVGLGD